MKAISKIAMLLLMLAAFASTASAGETREASIPAATYLPAASDDGTEKSDTLGRTVLLQDFSIKKIIKTDEAGNQILNEDGTVRYYYYVVDKNGTVWNASTVQTIYKIRSKAYKQIALKVLMGGGLGSLDKDKVKGLLVGTLSGCLASVGDVVTIFTLNKSLKKFRKQLEVYKKSFTDEGLPIDPSVDLSNVEGIDFTKSEELTKSAAEVKAELDASLENAPALENIQI